MCETKNQQKNHSKVFGFTPVNKEAMAYITAGFICIQVWAVQEQFCYPLDEKETETDVWTSHHVGKTQVYYRKMDENGQSRLRAAYCNASFKTVDF